VSASFASSKSEEYVNNMDTNQLLEFTHRGLLLALWITLPTVIAAAAIGIAVAVIQATTQLQDQTASLVFKLIVACLVLAVSAKWMSMNLLNFVDEMLRASGFHAPTLIL
jgi:type III secretion protein S